MSRGAPLERRRPEDATLGHALEEAAARSSRVRGLSWFDDRGRERSLTYAELLERARLWLGGLRALGVQPGDHLLLQIADGLDLWTAIWACFLGGVVPLSLAVEPSFEAEHPAVKKLIDAWARLEKPWILASDGLAPAVRRLGAELSLADLRVAALGALQGKPPAAPHRGRPDDPALMLLTSGSTGRAKVVVLSHHNLLSMSAGTIQMNGFTAEDVTLNWMPLDHVGALVFLGIVAVDLGCQQIHVPTDALLQRPLRWLEIIEERRATISWAPNFAFALINDQAEALAGRCLDLSSMRFLVNAGEQVGQRTMSRFLSILQAHGLPRDALRPAFGMSETCSGITWSAGLTLEHLAEDRPHLPLGRPIPGASLRITDDHGRLLAEGEVGRLELAGPSVMLGYYRDPERNREVFDGDGWFSTGDLGLIEDGQLVITGRKKQEIIVNGKNFAAHEIEALVEEVPGVRASHTAAFATRDPAREGEVLAVVVSPGSDDEAEWPLLVRKIRGHLARGLGLAPEHVVPLEPHLVPRTSIGKIQRDLLRTQLEEGRFAERLAQLAVRADEAAHAGEPLSAAEQRVASIWATVLGQPRVGRHDSFFELGGHSLLLVQVHAALEAAFGRSIPIADLFKHPTVTALARRLQGEGGENEAASAGARRATARNDRASRSSDIAVIGMACRFPGADDPDAFWQNLKDGVESIARLSDEELAAAGVPASLYGRPSFVKARPVVRGAELFDADFFGYSAREAELMDPQQRLFLECAWECLERAGYGGRRRTEIGVFAGASTNTYVLNHWAPRRGALHPDEGASVVTLDSMGGFQMMVANDKDYLTTRASYKLDLRGPSVNVQTACSTGLVAVHMAAQSLRYGECDMALCGGVSVNAPQETGYLYEEGMIVSRDGHCRAFDEQASGTVFGSGVGGVLLKRYEEALADGDTIYAVIKGSAVNNDGGDKLGYMAPGSGGQAAVVAEALAMAGVDPETIGLVEAHGTATPMGDPVEVESLTQAFRARTDKRRFCALGSVKTNVGHLQIASGIAGFMKAVLSLHHRAIPPTLHFQRPNPRILLDESPFFVNTRLLPWDALDQGGEAIPRRAGVHSLGIGGTNAHVILEEAPCAAPAEGLDRTHHVLSLSAKTAPALAARATQMGEHLRAHPALAPGDVCFTANAGRAHFGHRLAVVGSTIAEIEERLRAAAKGGGDAVHAGQVTDGPPPIALLFTGQGSQYGGMARRLYEAHPGFRATLDRGEAVFRERAGHSLLEIVFAEGDARLHHTRHAQPAVFLLEVALAELWSAWGAEPRAVLGHSLGAYAAACFAGVFSPEAGMALVVERAALMGALPEGGAMASVFALEAEVRRAIGDAGERLAIAATNGERHTVISGEREAVASVCAALGARGVTHKPLRVSHAFHSPLMRPMLARFEEVLRGVEMRPPRVPIISDTTGLPAGEEIASPAYWLRHVLEPVRFHEAVASLRQEGCAAFVEVGPQPTLLSMCGEALGAGATGVASLRPGRDDWSVLLSGVAQLYTQGVAIAWEAFDRPFRRRRVPLPTYPFERRRHVLPLGAGAAPSARPSAVAEALRAGDRERLLSALGAHADSRGSLSPAERELLPRLVDLLLECDRADEARPAHAGWIHGMQWSLRGRRAAPEVIAAEACAEAERRSVELDAARVASALGELESVSAALVVDALRALGLPLDRDAVISVDALIAGGRVLAQHERLLHRLLGMLVEDGILRQEGRAHRVVAAPPPLDPRAALARLRENAPEIAVEIDLFERCGLALGGVLGGQINPLELLFPGDEQGSALAFYRDSRVARAMTAAARRAVEVALSARVGRDPASPAGAGALPLRLLEIGAGTGSTTEALLSLLPAGSRYTFTDISPAFLGKARERLEAHAALEYCVLDIERDPAEQGFALGSFDVVIAANVLHATADLCGRTLPHVRSLLAPGGTLILQEATTPARWFDLIFGLTPGWWRFTDSDLRAEHPLLSGASWEAALRQSGFSEPRAASPDRALRAPLFRQSVIAASAPARGLPVERRWIIVADEGGIGEALARLLRQRGAGVSVVGSPGRDGAREGGTAVDRNDAEAWSSRLEEAFGQAAGAPVTVVHLPGLDLPDAAELSVAEIGRAQATCASLLPILKAISRRAEGQADLWLVTRGAVAAAEGDRATGLAQAPLWGLGRVIALEQPRCWGGMIDLAEEQRGVEEAARDVLEEILRPDGEDHIALRQGQRLCARLVPRPELAAERAPPVRADGAYLITGGLGNLGLRLARWLADRGARHLVLTTRGPAPEGAPPDARADERGAALARLEAQGVTVRVRQADVADERAMASLLERIAAEGPPLSGVFHLAGVSGAATRLDAMDSGAFAEVFRAKVQGSLILHRLLEGAVLDWFVLFSSAGAAWGAEGQAHYNAASHFMDALARHRRARGLPATSVGFGLMEGGGIVSADYEAWLESIGLAVIPAQAGFDAMAALAGACAHAVVARVEWQRFKAIYESRGPRPLLGALGAAPSPPREASAPAAEAGEGRGVQGPSARARLLSAPPAERRARLADVVRAELAHVLGLPPAAMGGDRAGFVTQGLDSLGAVELKNRLERALEARISTTLVFDYPTVERLTAHLATHVMGWPPPAPLGAPEAPARAPAADVELGEATLQEELESLERLLEGA